MKSIFHDSFNNTNRSKKYINKNLTFFLFTLSLIAFLTLLLSACDSTEPGKETSSLTVEDISCTEVWLKLSGNVSGDFILERNNKEVNRITLSGSDNIIYDDSLQPSTSYTYQVTNNQQQVTSNQVTAVTMDTTSHDFTWQTYTFGGGGSSILRDVAVIDENNIWAVGEIHTEDTDQFDSNGVWVQPYNAVHWDGQKWELKKILFYTFCNQTHKAPYQATSIFKFSDNTIAIASNASQITYISNGEQDRIDCIPSSINKIWGTSSNDIYVVGNNGNIAHWDGSNWKKIESGTDVDLVDIWGSPDGNTIWVCGNEDFKPTILLKIENQQAELLYSSRDNLFSYDFNRLSGNFRSVWTDSDNFLYILTSYDLYRAKNEDLTKPTALWRNADNQIATLRARGLGSNDIFTVGNEGLLCHYNGVSWRTYTGLYSRFKTYRGLSVKDNIIVAVGQDYINGIEDKAIITITKR